MKMYKLIPIVYIGEEQACTANRGPYEFDTAVFELKKMMTLGCGGTEEDIAVWYPPHSIQKVYIREIDE